MVVECVVNVVVEDDDALQRVVGPDGDAWRTGCYGYILTEDDALQHWAYNAVTNGEQDVTMLDGWADLPRNAVTMQVQDINFPFPARVRQTNQPKEIL